MFKQFLKIRVNAAPTNLLFWLTSRCLQRFKRESFIWLVSGCCFFLFGSTLLGGCGGSSAWVTVLLLMKEMAALTSTL